jgi:hypothetical protein
MEKKPPLLAVRPAFDSTLAAIESVPVGLAGVAASVFLGGTFFFMLFSLLGLGRLVSVGTIYIVFFVLGLALAPALYYELKKAACRRTAWLFHEEYLDYQDFRFFLLRRRGRVRMRDISDVVERTGLLQARRGLSSLHLVIPGFPALAQDGITGLKMIDVPARAGLREKIRDLIEGNYPVAAAAAP